MAASYNVTQSGPNPWYYVNSKTGTTDLGSYKTTTRYIDQQVINSVSTANWRKLRKRERNLIRHDYVKQVTNLKEYQGYFVEPGTYLDAGVTRTQTYYKQWNFGAWISASFPDLASTNSNWYGGDLTQQVNNKLLQKISEESQSSSTLVTLAEAHKTVSMVVQTATKLAEALKALKQLRFGDFTRALGVTATYATERRFGKKSKKVLYDLHMTDPRNGYMEAKKRSTIFKPQRAMKTYGQKPEFQKFLADTWLEYSYGWKPLLADVDDSMKALARHCVERNNVMRRVMARVEFDNPTSQAILVSGGYSQTFKRTENRKEQLIVWYRKPESILNALNNFGILNPLEVAWELIPFSFVADWFIPVGQALRNLTSTIGLEFAGGVRTRHTKATATGKIFGNGTSWQWNGAGSQMTCQGYCDKINNYFELKRSVLITFPAASWPEFKDPRSIAHGLSAVSLLSNLFLTGAPGSNRNLRT